MAAKPFTSSAASRARHLQDPPRRRTNRKPYPSSALLSILATIAASSSAVNGSPVTSQPTPPSFLCPSVTFIPPAVTPAPVLPDPEDAAGPSTVVDIVPSKTRRRRARFVPVQYSEGADGHWRRVSEYTLYGSKICPGCEPTPTATSHDVLGASDSVDAAASPTVDILGSLPTGWKLPSSSRGSRTVIILALSLVLALMICFFIIFSIFWRNNRRKKVHDDMEMKLRKKRKLDTSVDLEDKEARTKQKLWARATARWKSNARYAARQRRGKRGARSTQQSVASSDHPGSPDRRSIASISPTTSPNRSRVASAASSRHSSPSPTRRRSVSSDVATIHSVNVIESPDLSTQSTSLLPAASPSPPAYHHRGRLYPSLPIDFGYISPLTIATVPSSPIPPPDTSDTLDQNAHDDDKLQYSPPLHSAHVATDDKNILALMANSASAPPGSGDDPQPGPSELLPTVPVWEDEDINDIPIAADVCGQRSRPSSSTLPFPPPPSKAAMASSSFYDYPYAFEDITTLGSDSEPSAPPFEERQLSAPPLNDANLEPSAPPLLDEENPDDMYDDQEQDADVSHAEGIGTPAVPANDRTRPQHSHTSSYSTIYVPRVQGPVASDGTPPCYHP